MRLQFLQDSIRTILYCHDCFAQISTTAAWYDIIEQEGVPPTCAQRRVVRAAIHSRAEVRRA